MGVGRRAPLVQLPARGEESGVMRLLGLRRWLLALDKEVVLGDFVVRSACGTVLEDQGVELDVIESLGVDAEINDCAGRRTVAVDCVGHT